MRSHLIVVACATPSMTILASARERNHSRLRHSSRNLPLKLSVVPFCQGFVWIDQGGLDTLVDDPPVAPPPPRRNKLGTTLSDRR